jgi:hypothetical protein
MMVAMTPLPQWAPWKLVLIAWVAGAMLAVAVFAMAFDIARNYRSAFACQPTYLPAGTWVVAPNGQLVPAPPPLGAHP